MSIGPIQAFVIGFPDSDLFEGRIADELAFQALFPADNTREPQPLNDRPIVSDADSGHDDHHGAGED